MLTVTPTGAYGAGGHVICSHSPIDFGRKPLMRLRMSDAPRRRMEITLEGRTAVVTGGNVGIGRAISLALAKCEARIVMTTYDQDVTVLDEIGAFGGHASALPLDATDSQEVNHVFAEASRLLGGHIDILINNVGHLIGRVAIADMCDEHWDRVIAVNLTSAFYCTRAVLPYMNTGWGRIVNSSSLAAHDGGGAGSVAYAAAKAGIIGLTRGLARELAPLGVTVNAVAPGFIQGTAFHSTFTPAEVQESIIARTLLMRGGTPNDVAHTVLYLVSGMGDFITGEVAEINGGLWFA